MSEDRTKREANRLYWRTELTVGDIADRMDLSRGSLYRLLDPDPTGQRCPECGAPLVFVNRSGRADGEAECPECGLEVDLGRAREMEETRMEASIGQVSARGEAAAPPLPGSGHRGEPADVLARRMEGERDRWVAASAVSGPPGGDGGGRPSPEPERPRGTTPPLGTRDALRRGRVILVGGAMLAGAALGAAAAFLARRR